MKTYEKLGFLNSSFKIFHLIDTQMREYDYHYHDFNKLIIFLSGNVSYAVEGKNYKLKPYDLVLVKSGEIHKPQVLDESAYERIIIYISPEFMAAYSGENYDLGCCFKQASIQHTHVLRIPSFEKSKLYRTIKDLETSFQENAYAGELFQQLLFLEIMVHLNRAVLSEHIQYIDTKSYNEKILQTLDYISEHLAEEISVESLAASFYINKYYLMHLFKEETGYTIANYITNKRLLLARELMEKQTSITEVCYACGFKNYSSFSRAYKKCFQNTPRSYLNENL